MRRQEVSEGWSVAQVRDWIKGCAGEVMGEIDARLLGSVVLFGKRIGEVNGLGLLIAFCRVKRVNARIAEPRHLPQLVHNLVWIWPR